MRIVITGGSGGVGRATTRAAVDAGHTVLSLDRAEPKPESIVPGVEYRVFDLTDYDGFVAALTGADALIHLAAIPNQRTFPDHVTHNNNVVTSYNALRGAVDAGIKHVCQASSINAIGGAYSRQARYDYLPVDEQHPTYAEDPYSLSKWICEQQADSIARRYEDMTIGSLRFHWVVPDADLPRRLQAQIGRPVAMHLWGYTLFSSAAEACLRVIGADYKGHEVFYIVERDTVNEETTEELVKEFWPDIPIRGDISGHRSLFDCGKAERLLGWKSQPTR